MADNKAFHDGQGVLYTARMIDVGDGSFSIMAMVATAPYVVDKMSTLAVTTAAALLSTVTGGIPALSTHALISVPAGGGNITFTEDGLTTPTSTVGILIPAGDIAEIAVRPLSNVKLVASTGTVTITVSFRHYTAS